MSTIMDRVTGSKRASGDFSNYDLEDTIMLRHKWILAFGVALLTVAVAAQDAPDLKDQKEKVSYALGMQVGADFRKRTLDLDLATFSKGVVASFSGGKTMLTEEEMLTVLADAKEEYRKKQAALREEKAQATLREGAKFLAENKNKEGVVTLPSGLQYKILKQGNGDIPNFKEHVVCNYRGMLLDGTQFDNSNKHDGPSTFPMKGVIKGWTEALLRMPVGSKWQLFIPPDLAYGVAGAPSMNVPPDATLMYELELVAVKEVKAERRDRE
jgi:FKBP-type peptidyl-prolyl cis-trans isomerase